VSINVSSSQPAVVPPSHELVRHSSHYLLTVPDANTTATEPTTFDPWPNPSAENQICCRTYI